MSDIKLPEPVGFRSRYRSEPGMIGHYPWTYADHRRRKYDRPECEYEDLYTADQLRAAVEADRAQRVPDVVCDDDLSELAHSANQEALSFGLSHDVFMRYFKEVRRRLLASTPAPAQQEPVNAVAYLDIGAGGYMDLGTDMSDEALSLLPKGRHMLVIAGTYGVDGYTAAQHQEPPSAPAPAQQETTRDELDFDSDDAINRQQRNLACALALGQQVGCSRRQGRSNPETEKAFRLAVTAIAKQIAIAVAKNCNSVPQLTFPHIYLGLSDLFSENQDPPQQERKPMADEDGLRVAINACDSLNSTRIHEIGGKTRTICDDLGLLDIVRAVERHHGIKE